MKYHISEIFYSINGEVSPHGQGSPCVFIRFDGCNLKCSYCDTPETQGPPRGKEMSFPEIWQEVTEHKSCYNITITGGEPFCQDNIFLFIQSIPKHYNISIETNGSYYIPLMKRAWNIVMDYKLEQEENMINLKEQNFIEGDWIKFVVSSREQAEQIIPFLEQMPFLRNVKKAISVIDAGVNNELVDIILKSAKALQYHNFILNCQIHKFLKLK